MKLYNIGYLENDDFDLHGNIKMDKIESQNGGFGFKTGKHKKILVMVQANFCGHCTNAKPDFQNFADIDNDVFCTTIEGDSNKEKEKGLSDRLKSVYPDFRGFPHYALHNSNGKRIKKDVKHGRSLADLKKFSN